MTTTHYAAIQIDTRAVYGVGTSETRALSDARTAGRLTRAESDELAVVSCTSAAAAYVLEHGGQPSAALSVSRDGVCLRSEEE